MRTFIYANIRGNEDGVIEGQEKMVGIDCSTILTADAIQKKGIPVDNGYVFRATAGIGISRYDEALFSEEGYTELQKELAVKEAKRDPQALTYRDYQDVLMGRIMDAADNDMKKNKEDVKKGLDEPTQELLLRNDEMVKLQRENHELKAQNARVMTERDACYSARQTLAHNMPKGRSL